MIGSIQAFHDENKSSELLDEYCKLLIVASANRVVVIYRIYTAMEHFKFNETEENHMYRKFLNKWEDLWAEKTEKDEEDVEKEDTAVKVEKKVELVHKVLYSKSMTYGKIEIKKENIDLFNIMCRIKERT